MEHIAAFLLLVSCPGGTASCQEIPSPTAAYETVQDCEADLAAEMRNRELTPFVIGKCVEVDPAAFYEDAELVWDVSSSGVLTAEVVTYETYTVTELSRSGKGDRVER